MNWHILQCLRDSKYAQKHAWNFKLLASLAKLHSSSQHLIWIIRNGMLIQNTLYSAAGFVKVFGDSLSSLLQHIGKPHMPVVKALYGEESHSLVQNHRLLITLLMA